AHLDDGRAVTAELYERIRDEEVPSIRGPHVARGAAIFDRLTLNDELADFLTIPAYEELLQLEDANEPATAGGALSEGDRARLGDRSPLGWNRARLQRRGRPASS